jgi:hypothetical protein
MRAAQAEGIDELPDGTPVVGVDRRSRRGSASFDRSDSNTSGCHRVNGLVQLVDAVNGLIEADALERQDPQGQRVSRRP